jgi:hypothetical protein
MDDRKQAANTIQIFTDRAGVCHIAVAAGERRA